MTTTLARPTELLTPEMLARFDERAPAYDRSLPVGRRPAIWRHPFSECRLRRAINEPNPVFAKPRSAFSMVINCSTRRS